MSATRATVATRFWSKVSVTPACWLWTGAKQANGYGRFMAGERAVLVHRWAYTALVGPIDGNLTIDHLCRNTSCVNPDHLEVVTRELNAWRGSTNKDKTHCTKGHALTAENVYVSPSRPTVRDCRMCRKARSAAHQQRSRAVAA